ncbi:MAG: DIP1984 family protein [Ruminococcus sp.]|nr:DIP1984 family protein [Ruminococcus sp.]
MKLATALSNRADLQGRLNALETRLVANAKVQEGEKPDENPMELIAEKDRIIAELENLISKINLTNSKTESDGMTITEMLAKRDCLKTDIKIMRNFLSSSSAKMNRYSRTEIIIRSTVNVAELQKKVDALCKELREIDEKIQELNWTTELI